MVKAKILPIDGADFYWYAEKPKTAKKVSLEWVISCGFYGLFGISVEIVEVNHTNSRGKYAYRENIKMIWYKGRGGQTDARNKDWEQGGIENLYQRSSDYKKYPDGNNRMFYKFFWTGNFQRNKKRQIKVEYAYYQTLNKINRIVWFGFWKAELVRRYESKGLF